MVVNVTNKIPQILLNFDTFLIRVAESVGTTTAISIRHDLSTGAMAGGWEPLTEFTEAERKAWGRSGGHPLYRSGEMANSIRSKVSLSGNSSVVTQFGLPKTGERYIRFMGHYLHAGPIDVRGLVAEHGYGPKRMGAAQQLWFTQRVHDLVRAGHLSRPTGTVDPKMIHQPARSWFVPGQIRAFTRTVREVVNQLLRFLTTGRP